MGFKFFLLFLVLGSNSIAKKMDAFSIDESQSHRVAFQISPKTVDLRRWAPINIQNSGPHSVPSPPVDLYDFSIMRTGKGSGVELSIGAKANLEPDGFLRVLNIDDPNYSPVSIIDFNDVTLTKKDFFHSLLTTFSSSRAKEWRYSVKGAVLKDVDRGLLHVECPGDCSLSVEGIYEGYSLSKNGWLKFDFSLPRNSGWSVQVQTHVQLSGLGHRNTELWSPLTQVTSDSTNLLVDLYALLKDQHPLAEDATLNKIVIYFSRTVDKTKSFHDTPLRLGSIKLFPQLIEDSKPILFLPFQKMGESVDILKFWESRMPPTSGRLVLAHRSLDTSKINDDWRFMSSQSEKVPLAFVIDPVVADSLSNSELSEVLDQSLFLEDKSVWHSGASDVILRNQSTIPFVTYAINLNEKFPTDFFLKVFFRFEKITLTPLRLTVFGLDGDSKKHNESFLINGGQVVQLKNFRQIAGITLSFEDAPVDPENEPISIQIEGISLDHIQKSGSFRPRDSTHSVTQSFFSAHPERIETTVSQGGEFQLIKKLRFQWASIENLKIRYSISAAESLNERYFFKILCSAENSPDERIFPVNTDGLLEVPRCQLSGLEVFLGGNAARTLEQIRTDVRLLEISSVDSRASAAPLELTGQRDLALYGGIHFSTGPTSADWIQRVYPRLSKSFVSPAAKFGGGPLSLSEILGGGRKVLLNETLLEAGGHGFKTISENPFEEVTVSKDFTNYLNEQRSLGKKSTSSNRWPLAKILDKILSVIVLGLFVYFFCFFSKVMVFFDRFLIKSKHLNGTGFVLASLAFSVYFSSHPHRVTVAGVLLVLTYGLLVRYRIRNYLEQNFKVLAGRTQATPYLLGFLAMTLFCLINYFLGRKGTMELSAFISYLLFIVAIVIDLSSSDRLFPTESESLK